MRIRTVLVLAACCLAALMAVTTASARASTGTCTLSEELVTGNLAASSPAGSGLEDGKVYQYEIYAGNGLPPGPNVGGGQFVTSAGGSYLVETGTPVSFFESVYPALAPYDLTFVVYPRTGNADLSKRPVLAFCVLTVP